MQNSRSASRSLTKGSAFTLIELLVVLGVITLIGMTLLPALANSSSASKSMQCLNNHRRLMVAWKMYSEDFSDTLLASQAGLSGRVSWMSGLLDFNPGNSSNWNTNTDLVVSPAWRYVGTASVFRCPSDQSSVIVSQITIPRVRSYSLSSVFGKGEWLDSTFNSSQKVWKTYAKGADVRLPIHTFIFADEHPDSMNDGQIADSCTGNQATDPASSAKLIDWPASRHNGGCAFSFADGRAEVHRWSSQAIQLPMFYNGSAPLNLGLSAAYLDLHWLAANTTVKN